LAAAVGAAVLSTLDAASAPSPAGGDAAGFEREIAAWRADRDARLRSETGWLTLVGLFWLQPGDNRFGTDRSNSLVLPPDSGPAFAGSFVLEGGKVRLVPQPEAGITVNGAAPKGDAIKSDADGAPDEIRSGRIRLTLIRRGERLGIRAKDPESRIRTGFRGVESFPASPAWRVDARFERYDPPREIEIPTVLGRTEKMRVPGVARFTAGGKEVSLEPVLESPDARELFFIFRDGTSGNETYDAGRFLYTELPRNGRVTLDFNRAYNPPCAFTRWATCPLPPRTNWLPIRIDAGEKKYGVHP
jgi:hypothetical protein